jgi:hypothetical protein
MLGPNTRHEARTDTASRHDVPCRPEKLRAVPSPFPGRGVPGWPDGHIYSAVAAPSAAFDALLHALHRMVPTPFSLIVS